MFQGILSSSRCNDKKRFIVGCFIRATSLRSVVLSTVKSLLTVILCENCTLKVLVEGTGPNLVGGCQLNAVQHG